MKLYLTISILTLLSIASFSQDHNKKMDEMLDWVEEHFTVPKDSFEVESMTEYVLSTAIKAKDDELLARSYLIRAQIYEHKEQVDSAIRYSELSLNHFLKVSDAESLPKVYLKLEDLHKYNADYSLAMKNNFAALELYERSNNLRGVAECYTRLCDLLYYEDNYSGGIEYCDKAIAIQSTLDSPDELALSYRYRADNELQLETYNVALNSINTAIDILKESGRTDVELRGYFNTRGNIYKFMERFDDALATYEYNYQLTKESGKPESELIATIGNIGHVYTLQEKNAEAIPYMLEAIEIMDRSGNTQNLWENYMHVSVAYEGIGDLKNSLKYANLYAEGRAQFQRNTINNLEAELKVKYETEKKDETISNQSSTIAQQKKTQVLYISIAALLGLMTFGLLYFSKKRKERNEELTLVNEQLDIKTIKMNFF